MKKTLSVLMTICLLFAFAACGNKEDSKLWTIPVDNSQEGSLSLSEIADEIDAVELELTDESLIQEVVQVLTCDDYFVVVNSQRGKGYNIKEEGSSASVYFTDDIHTGKKVEIHLFDSDADKFYYLYANMDNAVDLEELNPTLYIGTLKKQGAKFRKS
jgi:hypothetical protein